MKKLLSLVLALCLLLSVSACALAAVSAEEIRDIEVGPDEHLNKGVSMRPSVTEGVSSPVLRFFPRDIPDLAQGIVPCAFL